MSEVDFFNDDRYAIDYIRNRGYASYSSIKNVRDKLIPGSAKGPWFDFGSELHSRYLEGVTLKTLSHAEEGQLFLMIRSLMNDKLASTLLKGSKVEQEFRCKLYGVEVLGYIDILNNHIADLKSTRLTNKQTFINEMDFLQAALYLAVTGKRDFYYIGISKELPHPVMVFNVRDYPERLMQAQSELKYWLRYIKSKL